MIIDSEYIALAKEALKHTKNKPKIIEYDDIELSLKHKDKIKIYEDKVKLLKPWIFEKSND